MQVELALGHARRLQVSIALDLGFEVRVVEQLILRGANVLVHLADDVLVESLARLRCGRESLL